MNAGRFEQVQEQAGPDAAGERPTLRVVSGDATPEEIAAVVAAVAATASEAPIERPPACSMWSAHGYAHRHIRATFAPSPHGWRTSFWPR